MNASHDASSFRSGESVLDDWLRQRALSNNDTAASRTYVVCAAGSKRVIGYFSLSMGQILARDVAGSMRRNMPTQIPAVLLGRLAIDATVQGTGLGRALLADAVRRSLVASRDVSARLVLVHAISPSAEAFSIHHGFVRLPLETSTLALDLVKLRA